MAANLSVLMRYVNSLYGCPVSTIFFIYDHHGQMDVPFITYATLSENIT